MTEDNKIVPFFAKAIILATGGSGQVYQWTTNPEVATGDGVAIASRSRVKISDLEFVQFHPTAFKGSTSPLFLLSERLRGEGAKLVDKKGNRFVDELLPRDELTRAIFEKQKSSEVYLTMSHLDKKEIIKKLPNIYKRLKTYGYDLTKDRVPITPAAHYQCGGVVTDLNGKTSIKNLFAVGEVARTGVHGANRLASNSLLEGVVFGKRVGEFLKKIQKSKEQKPACRQAGQKFQFKSQKFKLDQTNINTIKKFKIDIQKTMWEKVGIVRCKSEMLEALKQFEGCKKQIGDIKEKTGISLQLIEVLNLVEIALQITQAALNRPKSLGAHYLGRIN